MVPGQVLRTIIRRWRPNATAFGSSDECASIHLQKHSYTAFANADYENLIEHSNEKWLILPPFTPFTNASEIGTLIARRNFDEDSTTSPTTALKWILKCCPDLPRCLLQKLFRLRQVRKESSCAKTEERKLRRVGAKEFMDVGERIFLPKSVDDRSMTMKPENQNPSDQDELKFVSGLELYRDSAMIAINKPPGMPVQGGVGITRSLDELASKYLKYNYEESPRLVHRLDRDSSGILVMGRTQLSATVLHSIFREKTFGASNNIVESSKTLQKRYYALVIGTPRRHEGLISVPLGKVVVDNGKSERITVLENAHTSSAQNAVTEYRVIDSLSSGFTWIELSPHTGRKHQLRVHCAEVLGTPIVGDYKYGWQAHKNMKIFLPSDSQYKQHVKMPKKKPVSFHFATYEGALSDKKLLLHLHCKEMVLPNISSIFQHGNMVSGSDIARIESIQINAPLPAHMQKSWDLLNL